MRGFVLGLFEQIADTAGSDPDKQLDELGRGDREKRHAGFTGDGSTKESCRFPVGLPTARLLECVHRDNESFRLFPGR